MNRKSGTTMEIDKIYNVDSYKAIKEMPDKFVDLIVTDVPYDIKHTEGGGMLIDKGIKQMFDDIVDDNLQVGRFNAGESGASDQKHCWCGAVGCCACCRKCARRTDGGRRGVARPVQRRAVEHRAFRDGK